MYKQPAGSYNTNSLKLPRKATQYHYFDLPLCLSTLSKSTSNVVNAVFATIFWSRMTIPASTLTTASSSPRTTDPLTVWIKEVWIGRYGSKHFSPLNFCNKYSVRWRSTTPVPILVRDSRVIRGDWRRIPTLHWCMGQKCWDQSLHLSAENFKLFRIYLESCAYL